MADRSFNSEALNLEKKNPFTPPVFKTLFSQRLFFYQESS